MVSIRPDAIEEYVSLRQELYTIIQARYSILTTNVALVAAVIGAIIGVKDLSPWVLFVFPSILLPSLVMNYHLTKHFARIASYIYVRFEKLNSPFVFERALDKFKKLDKYSKPYTWPILLTYSLLVFFSLIVAAAYWIIFWMCLRQYTINSIQPWVGILVSVLGSLPLFMVIRLTWKAHQNEEDYRQLWEMALGRVESDRRKEQTSETP